MKIPHERTVRVEFPIFSGYTIYIVFTDDVVASRKKRNKVIGKPYTDTGFVDGLHTRMVDERGIAFIFFRHDVSDPGLIAHECWHAIHRLLEWLGAELDNEVVAYHLQYLVRKVWRNRKCK